MQDNNSKIREFLTELDDRQILIDSINRLIRQADIEKLNCIYRFVIHIL